MDWVRGRGEQREDWEHSSSVVGQPWGCGVLEVKWGKCPKEEGVVRRPLLLRAESGGERSEVLSDFAQCRVWLVGCRDRVLLCGLSLACHLAACISTGFVLCLKYFHFTGNIMCYRYIDGICQSPNMSLDIFIINKVSPLNAWKCTV